MVGDGGVGVIQVKYEFGVRVRRTSDVQPRTLLGERVRAAQGERAPPSFPKLTTIEIQRQSCRSLLRTYKTAERSYCNVLSDVDFWSRKCVKNATLLLRLSPLRLRAHALSRSPEFYRVLLLITQRARAGAVVVEESRAPNHTTACFKKSRVRTGVSLGAQIHRPWGFQKCK